MQLKGFAGILAVSRRKNDVDFRIELNKCVRERDSVRLPHFNVQKCNVGFFLLCAFDGLGGLSESVYFSVRNTFSDCADQAFQSETLVVNSKNHQRKHPLKHIAQAALRISICLHDEKAAVSVIL